MAHVHTTRGNATTSGGGGGGSISAANFVYLEHVKTVAFAGFSLALATGAIENSIRISYEGKSLMKGIDYTYNSGSNSVSILVADDPANYLNGECVFHIYYSKP